MKFVLLLLHVLGCIWINGGYAETVSIDLSHSDKVHFAVYEKLLKKSGMTAFFRPTKRFGVTWVFVDGRNTPIVFKGHIDAQMYTLQCSSFKAAACTLEKSNENVEDYKMKRRRGRHLCGGGDGGSDDESPNDNKCINPYHFYLQGDTCDYCKNNSKYDVETKSCIDCGNLIVSRNRLSCENTTETLEHFVNCGVNEWISSTDPTQCASCEHGQYRNINEIGCLPCEEGARVSTYILRDGVCEPDLNQGCPQRQYLQSSSGKCANCHTKLANNNKYQDEVGQTTCKTCEYVIPNGAIQCEEYAPCEPGYMISGSSCKKCYKGRYNPIHIRGTETVFCTSCPAGYYAFSEGNTECKSCPAGYNTSSTGSESLIKCKDENGHSYPPP